MVPILTSRDTDSEVLAALALFQKAAVVEQVDRALLNQIAIELWRSGGRIR
jgi:hypothetical protein